MGGLRKRLTGTTPLPGAAPGVNALLTAGGITGLWAETNTRNAIYDALKRKETFGSSGVRIKGRFFGGWNYPDFDNTVRAFYYVRVVENPVCRWSTRQANASGMAPPTNVPATIQERIWTSSIWYTPVGGKTRSFDMARAAAIIPYSKAGSRVRGEPSGSPLPSEPG